MKICKVCRRVFALLTVLAVMFCVLAGCGEEEEAAQITLRTISVMGDDGIKEAYTALLESYSAEFPHVYHIGTVAEYSNSYKLDALFEETYTASRYPHAVYYYTNTGMDELREHFVSVEEIRLSYPDFASDITEAALDSVRSDDGTAYCVPFAGRWTALAINRSILNRFDLQMPETWQQLITVCGILSARGITPVANGPDDCAALLELMCLNGGAQHALDSVIKSDSPLALSMDRKALAEVFCRYEELCGINCFPEPIVTEELELAIEALSTISGSDAASAAGALTNTARRDPVDMFNDGEAAMLIVDSSQFGRITLGNYSLTQFPVCDLSGESEQVMVGGFDTGWYITRRAFNDNTVRDAVVAFVDAMTDSRAAAAFSEMGFLPSADVTQTSFSDAAGLLELAGGGNKFAYSRINSVSSTRFLRLELIASAISLDLITPEQAVEMAADPSLRLIDVVRSPRNESEMPVSAGDAVIAP